jgi:two-component system, cell cycle sensor histidine kinase and response regulator CckA
MKDKVSPSVAAQPASVLIVDDEPGIRLYVERVLTTAGYRTTVAADCTEAIAFAAGAKFDLLLTDVMMPDMTGAALAARLREGDADLKVLYLTGHPDNLFDEKQVLLLEEAFLEKPCTATGLREAVSQAIDGTVTTAAAATTIAT